MKPTLKQTHFYVLMCLKGSNILGNQGLRSKYTSHSHATRCVRRGLSLLTCLLAWVELTQMYTWPRVSCALYSKSGVSNMIVHIMTFEEHTYMYTREFLGVCMQTIDTEYIFTWPHVPYVSFQALVPYVHIFSKIPLPAFLSNKIRYVTQALVAWHC